MIEQLEIKKKKILSLSMTKSHFDEDLLKIYINYVDSYVDCVNSCLNSNFKHKVDLKQERQFLLAVKGYIDRYKLNIVKKMKNKSKQKSLKRHLGGF